MARGSAARVPRHIHQEHAASNDRDAMALQMRAPRHDWDRVLADVCASVVRDDGNNRGQRPLDRCAALTLPRGPVREQYGSWDRFVM